MTRQRPFKAKSEVGILKSVFHAPGKHAAPGRLLSWKSGYRPILVLVALAATIIATSLVARAHEGHTVIVYWEAAGFVHPEMETRAAEISALAESEGYHVISTDDPTIFNPTDLADVEAVVFVSTSGTIMNETQRAAFQAFVEAGGGFVGVHSPGDTNNAWAWWADLVGSDFDSDPAGQHDGTLLVSDPNHPSTAGLPDVWETFDSWANYFPHPRETVHVLATADLRDLKGNLMGPDHPMAWCHTFGSARSWTTLLGHHIDAYTDPFFLLHVAGGLNWVTGNAPGDCEAGVESNYQKITLEENTLNPMEMAILDDGRILWIERSGLVKLYDPETSSSSTIHDLAVYTEFEDGLLGLALDPSFDSTGWIWLYYSVMPKSANMQRLSRFTFTGSALTEEVPYLEVPTDREGCCHHAAGSLAFDADGLLYIATGDNTLHSAFGAVDESSISTDAQRSSANTNDLRGKVLRIDPNGDGTYDIPPGNLFAPGTALTRPEIYLMGLRNPFRITIDPATGWLYTGDVGPDAKNFTSSGPAGHDEVIQAREAANYGWPYCIADNLPYNDPATGNAVDCSQLVNDSPHNTGLTDLPPAKSAFIWYSFNNDFNLDWPEIWDPECVPPVSTDCGNTIITGPVYRRPASAAPDALPEHYDGRLFISEWSRNWFKTARLDDLGNVINLEPFLPSIDLFSPIDVEIGPDGVLYVLEYGTGFGGNPDAALSKIVYQPENRLPTADISADPTNGGAPLTVQLSATGSSDPEDGNVAGVAWDFEDDGVVDSTALEPSHTFTTPGDYTVRLTVSDSQGAEGTSTVLISVGNSAPEISFIGPPTGAFIGWDEPVPYSVDVSDVEDDPIDGNDVITTSLLGHDAHAHPLTSQPGLSGTFSFDRAGHTDVENAFGVLETTYTDEGTAQNAPLTSSAVAVLNPHLKQAEFNTDASGVSLVTSEDDPAGGADVSSIDDGDWLAFDPIALDGIHSVTARVVPNLPGSIVFHSGSPTGPVVGSIDVPAGSGTPSYLSITGSIADSGSISLFAVFESSSPGAGDLFDINWFHFNGDGVAAPDTTAPTLIGAEGSGNTVLVEFDEPVDQASAENLSSYSLDGGVSITDAVLGGDLKTVTLTTGDLGDGDYTLTVSGVIDRSNAGNEVAPGSTASFAAGSGVVGTLFRVNAGGPLVAATDGGPDWEADSSTSPNPAHNSGSNTATWPPVTSLDGSVPSSTPAEVFSSERWDPPTGNEMEWDIPVASGTEVEVRLYFANSHTPSNQVGARVFDVTLDGNLVLDDYDIFADVGGFTGVMKAFTITSDGNVDIDFGHVTQNPLVNAIEIVATDGGGEPPANQSPVVDTISNQSVTEGDSLTFGVSASDPDGDLVTLTDTGTPAFGSFTDNGDGTGTFTFNPAVSDAGSYDITVTATDPDNATDTDTFTLTVNPETTGGGNVLFRVNAGGSLVAATDGGPDWAEDTSTNPNPAHNNVSNTANWPQPTSLDPSVPSTTPIDVFGPIRWDPGPLPEMEWDIPVASGTEVEVRLYFANSHTPSNQVGARVFDVTLDGNLVLDDYDIFADVGGFTGVMKAFTITSDGNVDIDFGHVAGNPIISAIEIIATN
ncbi:MAG TPA: ThuA domain-containing protein [Acidimicrobiia bacterium]|nr:ThuA domain-containing protein [Acidimicrobiia bacterium]